MGKAVKCNTNLQKKIIRLLKKRQGLDTPLNPPQDSSYSNEI